MIKSKIFKTILTGFIILFSGCGNKQKLVLSDGIFQGTGAGRNGPIVVEINISEGKLQDAKIIEEQETPDIGGYAEKELLEYFVKSGGDTDIDAISGATLTSNGVISALQSALDASHGKIEAKIVYKDCEADIVIIGAGGAGLTAATEAASNGAKVIVLEKAGIIGGNTNSSTGGLNASQTTVQKKLKIEDSNDQFYNDTMKGGHFKNDEKLVHTLVEKSAEIINWLQSDLIGVDLSDVGIMGGSTNKRTHRPAGGQAIGAHLIPKLYDSAKNSGAEIRHNNQATNIFEENGRACGVEVKNDVCTYKIKAKAIIIATGGFGANPKLIEKYRPDLKDFPTTNVQTTTGDAFEWVKKFNVQLRLMDEIQIHPSVVPEKGILITEAVRGNGAIMISHAGKRFVNELDTRDVTSKAILSLPEKKAFIFFNQEVRKSLKAIENYDKAGVLISGNTLDEISQKIGINPVIIKNTIETYEKAYSSGTDLSYGRKNMAVSLKNGPYYAIEIEPAIHHTMGGIAINEKSQVLKEDGSTVPGLFAAGEVTGGVHGDNRLGGNAVADITIFGKIAADSALEEIKTTER